MNVTSIPLWDEVGRKLTDLMNQGDTSVSKLIPLFVLILLTLAEKREEEKQAQLSPSAIPPSLHL